MSERVILHVGTPKTGTTLLQDVLFRNRELLAAYGVLYPAERFDEHFLAALDLMRLPWEGIEADADGVWDRLAAAARVFEGTTIISHEILARATAAEAAYALSTLGEAEVHVVVSARDLVRQIPAEWQENVKDHVTFTYAEFLDVIRDPARTSPVGAWFWSVQELPDVLARWAGSLPPQRVHVVTVPPPGAARGVLWERFVAAFGLAGVPLDTATERENAGLGAGEIALVRRLNLALGESLSLRGYRDLVRELLAHNTLSKRRSPKVTLPPELVDWAAGLGRRWADELADRGYDVIGDLDDLVATPPAAWSDPDAVTQIGEPALDALVAVLAEADRARTSEAALRGALAQAEAELAWWRRTPKEKAFARLDASAPGRGALAAYRRLRGDGPPA